MTRRKRRKRGQPRRSARRPSSPSPFSPGVQFAVNPTIGTDGRVPRAAQPKPTEPMFLDLDRVVEEEKPASEEELEALLSRYMVPGRKPRFPKPTRPRHKA